MDYISIKKSLQEMKKPVDSYLQHANRLKIHQVYLCSVRLNSFRFSTFKSDTLKTYLIFQFYIKNKL